MNDSANRWRSALIGGAAILLCAAGPVPGRVAIGQYGRWAALRDAAPARCFAIAEPVAERAGGAALSVARWPRVAGPSQVHVRFARAIDPRRPITLEAGGHRFALIGRVAEAWARDARDDLRIVAAMRRGAMATIVATEQGGHHVRQGYALHGAPSAIDAARIACGD